MDLATKVATGSSLTWTALNSRVESAFQRYLMQLELMLAALLRIRQQELDEFRGSRSANIADGGGSHSKYSLVQENRWWSVVDSLQP